MLLMIGNGVLSAEKEKPGAILEVQKKDGQTINGELLVVKNGILTLLVYKNATKVDVRLDELSSIRIKKKGSFHRALKGLAIGVLAGVAIGSLIDSASTNEESFLSRDPHYWKGFVGTIGGLIGFTTGGLLKGRGKSIQLDNGAPEKLIGIETMLTSLARHQPDVVAELRIVPKFSRWHIFINPGSFHSQGEGQLNSAIEKIGFGDDRTSKTFSHVSVSQFPTAAGTFNDFGQDSLSIMKFGAEYSLSRWLAIGFAYAPLGTPVIWGFKLMERIEPNWNPDGEWSDWGLYFGSYFRGNSYFLTSAFTIFQDKFIKNTMLKLRAGVGGSSIKGALITSLHPFDVDKEGEISDKVDKREFTRQVLSMMVSAGFDFNVVRYLSLGINIDYKYVPFRTDACQLVTPYTYNDRTYEFKIDATPVDVPVLRINAGGWGFAVSLGFHF